MMVLILLWGCGAEGECHATTVGDVAEYQRDSNVAASLAILEGMQGSSRAVYGTESLSLEFSADAESFAIRTEDDVCKVEEAPVEAVLASAASSVDSPDGGCIIGSDIEGFVGVACNLGGTDGSEWDIGSAEGGEMTVTFPAALVGGGDGQLTVSEWTRID